MKYLLHGQKDIRKKIIKPMKIYNYKNFILEYKHRDDPSSVIEDFSDLYIDRISKKFNTSIVKKLGMGAFGIAYLTKNNKVLKVTTDQNEAKNVLALKNKKFKHFLNYYDVFSLTLDGKSFPNINPMDMFGSYDNSSIYFILMDYVKPLTNYKKDLWRKFGASVLVKPGEFFDDYIEDGEFLEYVGKQMDYTIKNSTKFSEKDKKRVLSYFENIIDQRDSFLDETEEIGTNLSEVHPGNLGEKRDGTIVYFDIGFSDSGIIDVDTGDQPSLEDIPSINLENDFTKIKNMITSNYEKETPIPINQVISDISKLLNVNKVKAYKYLRDEVWTYRKVAFKKLKTKPIYFTYKRNGKFEQKSSDIQPKWKRKGYEIYLVWKDTYKDLSLGDL